MTHRLSPATPIRASRRLARGFTLVELIVAMAAGLLVAMAAVLLAKGATRFFQHEARVSSAHMAAMLGLGRITADLQRAGFHSSPNVVKERLNNGICQDTATWPDGMRRLAGIYIKRQGSALDNAGQLDQSIANGFRPDAIVIGGSFNTVEQFRFNSVRCQAGGCLVHLQGDSVAMKRTRQRNLAGGGTIEDLFKEKRLLRLQFDGQTKYLYGVIDRIDTDSVPPPMNSYTVLLKPLPDLVAGDSDCGPSDKGFGGDGGYANPVSRVRYEIRSLAADPKYGPLVAPVNPAVTGDNGRTELVRFELDEANVEIPDTLELIAEYAVDLKFGITAATESGIPGTKNPQINRYPISLPESSDVYNIAKDVTDFGSPERIRSVQVRLSTRTRAPDREVDLERRDDGRKLRFLLPGIVPTVNSDYDPVPAGAPDIYARMRTFYVDVALPNQAGVEW